MTASPQTPTKGQSDAVLLPASAERPVGLVPGTRDWLTTDCARLSALEASLFDSFARAGYLRIRTPVLEYI